MLERIFGYTAIEQIASGESYSTNVKLQRNINKSYWVGKISRPLPARIDNFRNTGRPYIRSIDFRDLDDRAMLGFRLAKLAGLNSLKTKIIPISRVQNFNVDQIHNRINDNMFLSEFKGQSLTNYLKDHSFESFESSDIKNKFEAIHSFVFNLWIGNYDNKDKDYLVDDDKYLISIDYHLLGPGFQSNDKLALGAWGESFDMDQVSDTGWCIGDGRLLDYLKNSTRDWQPFEETINKINSISKFQIKWTMRDLNFYNQGTRKNINDLFYNFLLDRRPKLEQTIKQWISAGCPITQLPKDNGIV